MWVQSSIVLLVLSTAAAASGNVGKFNGRLVGVGSRVAVRVDPLKCPGKGTHPVKMVSGGVSGSESEWR
jgi:hypothetical protein